jgi:hypothetical protein
VNISPTTHWTDDCGVTRTLCRQLRAIDDDSFSGPRF